MSDNIHVLAAMINLYQGELEVAQKVGNRVTNLNIEVYTDSIGVEITVDENDIRSNTLNNDGSWQDTSRNVADTWQCGKNNQSHWFREAIKDIQKENLKCSETAIETLILNSKKAQTELDQAAKALDDAYKVRNNLAKNLDK